MLTCSSCGQSFLPQSAAWGDETCGQCIAKRLEWMLMAGTEVRERRPMRRADSLVAPTEEAAANAERRQA